MQRAERATKIMGILNKIYPKTPIPLNHKNKFELLISVLLSAQCTDKRVNEITPILFNCLLYTSPSPRDATLSRMPSSA